MVHLTLQKFTIRAILASQGYKTSEVLKTSRYFQGIPAWKWSPAECARAQGLYDGHFVCWGTEIIGTENILKTTSSSPAV